MCRRSANRRSSPVIVPEVPSRIRVLAMPDRTCDAPRRPALSGSTRCISAPSRVAHVLTNPSAMKLCQRASRRIRSVLCSSGGEQPWFCGRGREPDQRPVAELSSPGPPHGSTACRVVPQVGHVPFRAYPRAPSRSRIAADEARERCQSREGCPGSQCLNQPPRSRSCSFPR